MRLDFVMSNQVLAAETIKSAYHISEETTIVAVLSSNIVHYAPYPEVNEGM